MYHPNRVNDVFPVLESSKKDGDESTFGSSDVIMSTLYSPNEIEVGIEGTEITTD